MKYNQKQKQLEFHGEQAPPETHADFINSVVEDELKRKSGTAKPTNFKTVDQIKIDLPEDFAYNLEDIDYCFMQNASINEN